MPEVLDSNLTLWKLRVLTIESLGNALREVKNRTRPTSRFDRVPPRPKHEAVRPMRTLNRPEPKAMSFTRYGCRLKKECEFRPVLLE